MHREPIRILHMIASLNIGGSQSMVMNIYRNIDRERIGFDFIIDHPDEQYLRDEITKLGGKIYEMPTFRGSNIISVKKAWNDFFDQHPEYRILHSHSRSYASVYIPIAKKHGVKVIVHSHSTNNGKGFKAAVKKVLQLPLRYQADYMFACSVDSGKWLFGKKAVGKNNFHILKNAVDTRLYKPDSEVRKEYRNKLGAEDDTIVYLHTGRFHPAKNHMFLLDIFREIHRKEERTLLVLVGDGELRPQIENKIKTLGLEKNVLLLGNRNDVPSLLQTADAVIFPSLWEGLPTAIVEAQAAGLPCYISDNITDEVCISELVRKIPLSADAEKWADDILSGNNTRLDVTTEIRNAGFAVDQTASWLCDFYEGLLK